MTGNFATAPLLLLQATSRARKLHGRNLVVKLGGSAMEDAESTRGTLQSLAALQTLGLRVIVVHGGGKPIDRAMAAAGLEPRKVLGRRYTDDETLAVVVQVLGEINRGLIASLQEHGGRAAGFPISLSNSSQYPLNGRKLLLQDTRGQDVDLGHVGEVDVVDAAVLNALVDQGQIPILASLARSTQGSVPWLNINADTAAGAVAGAIQAEACYFLTDTPGVLRDVREPESRISHLTSSECRQLIAEGVIAGGMIPKVEACFDALAAGARRAVILDGRDPYSLLGEFVSDSVTGTEIVN